MARIRTIKPEFWSSEQIMDCKPLTRLLFIGLWNFVDDYGRAPVAPRTIKAQIMPGDDISGGDIQDMLNELSSLGLILFYSVDDKEYFEITGWAKHQKIDNPSKYKVCPAPFAKSSEEIARTSEDSKQIGLEGKGRESKVKVEEAPVADAPTKPDKKSRKRPKVSIGDGFALADKPRAYARSLGFSDTEIDREIQRFIRHAKQNDRQCADWQLAAENWFDKAAEFTNKQPPLTVVQLDQIKGMFYAKENSDQLAAWDRHYRDLRGTGCPRDKNQGWLVPSEWPPGYVPRSDTEPIAVPALRMRSI